MCAEAALEELQLPANQEDFEGLHLEVDGEAVRSSPADTVIDTQPMAESLSPEISSTRAVISDALVVLAVDTNMGKIQLPMRAQVESLSGEARRIRLFDEAGTLNLTLRFRSDDLVNANITMRYSEQPLDAALASARFFEVLATTLGTLFLESPEPNPDRTPMAGLPLSIPEPDIAEHRDRLRLLEALYEIWRETGVEIRYPAEPETERDLDNLNLVLRAIRGGWVAQQVESINIGVAEADVRSVLAQLEETDEVRRAFVFDLPDESYHVFGKRVDLGPSRRYLADARLTTTREEIERWLGEGAGSQDTLPLRWESVDDIPVHIFFEDWPKSSLRSVKQDLWELEHTYGVDSERFKQAWGQSENWARGLPDGKRWFSLIQAREELTQEP
jgi:hypothetical protein